MEPTLSNEKQDGRIGRTSSASNYKWKVLFSVVFGTFMVILDSTAVNVAIPTLQRVFKAPVDQVDSVLTAYVLALGIVTPLAGYLSERFGIKRLYLVALGLFVCGSVLCGFAPSLLWLIFFRALQGLGGGILGPLGIALLFGAFPEKERGLAFGLYGIPLVVAPASGPVLGGYFVQYLNWRYIFFINLPISLLGIVLAGFWLRENRRGSSARLDVPGVLLSTVSFGVLLYAIQQGANDGWGSIRIISLLIIGIITLLVFIVVELRAKEPLLNLRLFGRRAFACASIIGWVSTIALFGAEFLLPIYLQSLRGRTPLEAGLLVLPLAISAGVITPLAGAFYNKLGGRWLIFIGSILLAFNTWELAHLTTETSYLEIMGIVAVRGIALGLILQTTLTAALTGLLPAQLPRASSLLSATRNVFQSFGIAVLGAILTNQLTNAQNTALSALHNPLTALGQQFVKLTQALQQSGLSLAAANQAAAAQLLGSAYPQWFVQALNDAYTVTFWMALLTALLALTLPGRVRSRQNVGATEEATALTEDVQPLSAQTGEALL
ncbi:MAG TPA: DHA2 family efflux MFS transporter permease subunit [Ktedonobacteraceae bacterium]